MNGRLLFAYKAFNYFLMRTQQRLRRTRLFGKPFCLFLDPILACQLHCPFCGLGERTKAHIDFDGFEEIMHQLGRACIKLNLYNWGEPTLNKDLPRMIAHATDKYNIKVKISSNFNLENDEYWREIVRAGLRELVVSLDGASEETYKIYRVGGSFDRVIHNIKVVQDEKKRLKTKFPLVYWQFLVFKHNEHEIEKAREMAKELLMDGFHLVSPTMRESEKAEWSSTLPEYSKQVCNQLDDTDCPMCDWPWTSMTINANGSVSACCGVQNEKDDFGQLLSQGKVRFKAVWNGPDYVRARKAIIEDRIDPESNNICLRCTIRGRINKAPRFAGWVLPACKRKYITLRQKFQRPFTRMDL